MYRRAGAGLDAAAKQRLKDIAAQLATLGTTFSQNVLADEQSYTMRLGEDDLTGLPDFPQGAAARPPARSAALKGIRDARALQRRAVPAVLQPARPARKGVPRLDRARRQRGCDRQQPGDHRDDGAARRTRAPARLSKFRALQARRHDGEDAGRRVRPARCRLGAGAPPRRPGARRPAGYGRPPRAEFPARAVGLALRREAAQGALRSRRERDQTPYLLLENIIEAAFYTANRLFGLSFAPRQDVPVYHPDVRVWDVSAADGRHVGVFFGDYFARAQAQRRLDDEPARAGQARRRGAAARPQCDELQQGRRGRRRF